MRQKQPALVVTFSTTSEAMAAEKYSGERGLPGRLIPVPREITAGCGLAWKAPPEAEEELLAAWRGGLADRGDAAPKQAVSFVERGADGARPGAGRLHVKGRAHFLAIRHHTHAVLRQIPPRGRACILPAAERFELQQLG